MNRASDESAERMDTTESSRGSAAHEHCQQRVRTSDPITKVVSKVAKVRPSLAADAASARPSHVERRRPHQISTRPDLPAARKRVWSCLEYQPGKANDNASANADGAWAPEPFTPLASLGPPSLPRASAAPSARPGSSRPVARESTRPARASAPPVRESTLPGRRSNPPALREATPPAAPTRASSAPSVRPSVPAPRPSLPPSGTAAERRPALVPPSPKAAPRPEPFGKSGSAPPAAIHSAPTVVGMASVRPARVSTQRPVRRSAPPALLDYGSDVSQVVLSESGRLLNSTNGADEELLAETVGFTHRLATLTARALGFSGCPAMYLRSATTAIIVSEREPALVSGVSGKVDSLGGALTRVGLE
jgi:hypothetical protein